MENRIAHIEFNIYADTENGGAALKKAICDFIAYHGNMGVKVTAEKVANAINHWQDNLFVKNKVTNYLRK